MRRSSVLLLLSTATGFFVGGNQRQRRRLMSTSSDLLPPELRDDPKLGERLLCASVMAQQIQDDGSVTTEERYVRGAGFKSYATVIGGLDKNDACLVGRTEADDAVVVAFRGTVVNEGPTLLSDWVSNAQFHLSRVRDFPGRVHAGYYASTAGIWSPGKLRTTSFESWIRRLLFRPLAALRVEDPEVWLEDEIKRQLDASTSKKLYITGHSKGASMVVVAAALAHLNLDIGSQNLLAVPFAPANTGSRKFARGLVDLGVRLCTYENYEDILTLFPSQIVSYLTPRSDDAEELATDLLAPAADCLKALTDQEKAQRDGDDDRRYAPVGTRVVIGENGVLSSPAQSPDNERLDFIIELFRDQQDLGLLGFTHAKSCPSDDQASQARYMMAVGAFDSICGGGASS